MIKKIVSVIIIFILLTLPVITFATSGSLDAKKNELQNNINEAKDQQKEVKDEITQTQSEINKLNDEITLKEYEIEIITAEVKKLQSEVNELSQKLKEAEENFEEQYDMLGKRLSAQKKRGKVSYLDVLLKSKNLTDFISRYHILEKVAEMDIKLLEDIKEEQETITTAKQEIEKKKEEVELKQKELKNEEYALINRKSSKNKYMSQLSAEEQKLQNEIDSFNKDLKRVEDQILEEARKANSGGYNYTGGELYWPTPASTRITSYFGYRGSAATGGVGTANHNGYDIGAPHNSSIVSAEAGIVTKVVRACSHDYPKTYKTKCNCGGGYGNYLIVTHGPNLQTLYGHCASIKVNVGDHVTRGQTIAAVGSAGWSTGYHLHFSVIANGSYVNPGNYFK
ncbi:MAG: peptidoglycan DD-metalloendopeptidase family protein [Clostridia bacterium]|jgi:murein DD-endopeptidase MepM/ murein hydrolase activator NlpD|nr:peptidoglycan DD-metalloendopeptidase family protein [Clostridia bacterium]